MSAPRLLLLAALAAAAVGVYASGLADRLSWAELAARQGELRAWVDRDPAAAAATFFLLEVGLLALSVPVAAGMTVLAGFLFPFWLALLLVSFGSATAAGLAFLTSRYLARDLVRRNLRRDWLEAMDRGLAREGVWFLLALRLNPFIPFFAINLGLGLTGMPLRKFWLVSQLGMLPLTAIYVSAGAALGTIRRPADVLSPPVLVAFALLGTVPFLVRWLLGRLRPAGEDHK